MADAFLLCFQVAGRRAHAPVPPFAQIIVIPEEADFELTPMNEDEAAERDLQALRIHANRPKLAAGTEWTSTIDTVFDGTYRHLHRAAKEKSRSTLSAVMGQDGKLTLPSRLLLSLVAMMVVVTMPPDHDHRRSTPIAVVMMMVMMVILGELDVGICRDGSALVHDLQDRCSVRDRVQQFCVSGSAGSCAGPGAACAPQRVPSAATAPCASVPGREARALVCRA